VNAIRQAQNAYGKTDHPMRTPRGTEYEAVARITQGLKAAAERQPVSMTELARAVNENRRLWILFAAQVADPDNPLPKDLRARIFYLSEFTGDHSRKVLRREADVTALIEVNTAIMRGLRGGSEAR
jgi:flagellar protein FlaF